MVRDFASQGPSCMQAALHGPFTALHLSIHPCPPLVAPGQVKGTASRAWEGELKCHMRGGGGKDTGQEALRFAIHPFAYLIHCWGVQLRSPICSTSRIISWLFSEVALSRGGS